MSDFTDDELLAYAEERLSTDSCAVIEQSLRVNSSLVERLTTLLLQRDQGNFSVGDLWRHHRLSCPPRAVWAAYVDSRLGDGLSKYLQFHLEMIGCRVCSANLDDLNRRDPLTEAERRTRKIFQSSAGNLSQFDVKS